MEIALPPQNFFIITLKSDLLEDGNLLEYTGAETGGTTIVKIRPLGGWK